MVRSDSGEGDDVMTQPERQFGGRHSCSQFVSTTISVNHGLLIFLSCVRIRKGMTDCLSMARGFSKWQHLGYLFSSVFRLPCPYLES